MFQDLNNAQKAAHIKNYFHILMQEIYNLPQSVSKYLDDDKDIEKVFNHINSLCEKNKTDNKPQCTCANCYYMNDAFEFKIIPDDLFPLLKVAKKIAINKVNGVK